MGHRQRFRPYTKVIILNVSLSPPPKAVSVPRLIKRWYFFRDFSSTYPQLTSFFFPLF